jgi:two-component sensor histidine kinase
VASCETRVWRGYAATKAQLAAALVREQELLREKSELLQRQEMLAAEFEHRLVNGLQIVASLLSLQSRTAPTVEAAAQLTIAAERVAAFGRVHRRLHLFDHQNALSSSNISGTCATTLRTCCFRRERGAPWW